MLVRIIFSATYSNLEQALDTEGLIYTRGAFTDLGNDVGGMLQAYVDSSMLPTLAALGTVRELTPGTSAPGAANNPPPMDLFYF